MTSPTLSPQVTTHITTAQALSHPKSRADIAPAFKLSLLSACLFGLVACGGGSDHGVRAGLPNTPASSIASSSSSSVPPVASCNPVLSGDEGLTLLKTD